MTIIELRTLLDLQTKAYESVLWLHNYSYAHPELLTESVATALLDPRTSSDWLKANVEKLPSRLRPAAAELDRFANLFASFFQTSFRIERRQLRNEPPHFKLKTITDLASVKDDFGTRRKVPRSVKAQRRDELAACVSEAVRTLAPDDVTVTDDALNAITCDAALHDDVVLWTYAFDLAARAEGRPHGPVGHMLWRMMDEAKRKALTAEQVWASRERLISALRSATGRETGGVAGRSS